MENSYYFKNTWTIVTMPTPIEEFKEIIDAGLIREKFAIHAHDETLESLRIFLKSYEYNRGGSSSVGVCMIRYGAMTPEIIENMIICDNNDTYGRNHKFPLMATDNYKLVVELWGKILGEYATSGFIKCLENGALSPAVTMQIFKKHSSFLKHSHNIETLASIMDGPSNAINWGITGIFEYESARKTALNYDSRRKEFLTERHKLLRAMRTTEHVSEKRAQVEAVVKSDDVRPFAEQLEAVWQHYSVQSPLFVSISHEVTISGDARAKNVASVNNRQISSQSIDPDELSSPDKRFIDIYGRYNSGEMDPLMLTMIARTVSWYIDNQHASLFTNIWLVPDRFVHDYSRVDHIPWSALALCRRISVLNVKGEAFKTSLLGANRIFLTTSSATDATAQNSIPIIGLATWQNESKVAQNEPYAILEADFDQGDRSREITQRWRHKDYSASISGTIHATLQALREAETLEIARANGVLLQLGREGRWLAQLPKELAVAEADYNFSQPDNDEWLSPHRPIALEIGTASQKSSQSGEAEVPAYHTRSPIIRYISRLSKMMTELVIGG